MLRDPKINRVWDIDAIVTRATPVSCGTLIIEFADVKTGLAPDSVIFSDDRSDPEALNFASLYL